MTRAGRAQGQGKLVKVKRGRGDATWVLDWSDSTGARRRQVLSRDRRVAERLRTELISKRDLELAGLSSIEGQSRGLVEVRDLYLQDLGPRCTPKHLRNVRDRIERVLVGVRVRRVRDLQPHLLLQHRARRVAAGLGHASANHEIRNFRSMLIWAERAGLIAQNPVRSIKALPLDKGHLRRRRRAMGDAEIERFLAAARADDEAMQAYVAAEKTIASGTKSKAWDERVRGLRVPQAPVFLAFLETAARFNELVCTNWADLDLQRRCLTLRATNTKNGRCRVIPLRDVLMRVLVDLRATHEVILGRAPRDTDRIFLSPQGLPWPGISKPLLRILWRVLERAGIERVDANGAVLDLHALRHSAATRLARAGVPITHTQKLLGHSSIEVTQRYYLHLELEDLREAVERVGAEPRRFG